MENKLNDNELENVSGGVMPVIFADDAKNASLSSDGSGTTATCRHCGEINPVHGSTSKSFPCIKCGRIITVG